MKKILLVLGILLILSLPSALCGDYDEKVFVDPALESKTGTIKAIVTYNTLDSRIIKILKENNIEVNKQFKDLNAVAVEIKKEEIETLAATDFVTGIFEDKKYTLTKMPEASIFELAKQTDVFKPLLERTKNMLGMQSVWDMDITGKGVKVAILDTGVDGNHPGLVGKVVEAKDLTLLDDHKYDPTDGHGHGTHVAGIIAGSGAESALEITFENEGSFLNYSNAWITEEPYNFKTFISHDESAMLSHPAIQVKPGDTQYTFYADNDFGFTGNVYAWEDGDHYRFGIIVGQSGWFEFDVYEDKILNLIINGGPMVEDFSGSGEINGVKYEYLLNDTNGYVRLVSAETKIIYTDGDRDFSTPNDLYHAVAVNMSNFVKSPYCMPAEVESPYYMSAEDCYPAEGSYLSVLSFDNETDTAVVGIKKMYDEKFDVYKGIAPDAQLYSGKVLYDFGYGYESEIIAGIEWGVNKKVDIISMSLGGWDYGLCNSPMDIAVSNAVKEGVILTVAAGNSYNKRTISSPACSEETIAVGATSYYEDVAYFSSKGPTKDGRAKPEVLAPGVDVISAGKVQVGGITYRYMPMSGTSMATPVVAGIAALIKEANPALTPEDVKTILMNTADDTGESIEAQGAGVVNPYKAVKAAQGEEALAYPAKINSEFFQGDGEEKNEFSVETNLTSPVVDFEFTSFDTKPSRSETIENTLSEIHTYSYGIYNTEIELYSGESYDYNAEDGEVYTIRLDKTENSSDFGVVLSTFCVEKLSSHEYECRTTVIGQEAQLFDYYGPVITINSADPEAYKGDVMTGKANFQIGETMKFTVGENDKKFNINLESEDEWTYFCATPLEGTAGWCTMAGYGVSVEHPQTGKWVVVVGRFGSVNEDSQAISFSINTDFYNEIEAPIDFSYVMEEAESEEGNTILRITSDPLPEATGLYTGKIRIHGIHNEEEQKIVIPAAFIVHSRLELNVDTLSIETQLRSGEYQAYYFDNPVDEYAYAKDISISGGDNVEVLARRPGMESYSIAPSGNGEPWQVLDPNGRSKILLYTAYGGGGYSMQTVYNKLAGESTVFGLTSDGQGSFTSKLTNFLADYSFGAGATKMPQIHAKENDIDVTTIDYDPEGEYAINEFEFFIPESYEPSKMIKFSWTSDKPIRPFEMMLLDNEGNIKYSSRIIPGTNWEGNSEVSTAFFADMLEPGKNRMLQKSISESEIYPAGGYTEEKKQTEETEAINAPAPLIETFGLYDTDIISNINYEDGLLSFDANIPEDMRSNEIGGIIYLDGNWIKDETTITEEITVKFYLIDTQFFNNLIKVETLTSASEVGASEDVEITTNIYNPFYIYLPMNLRVYIADGMSEKVISETPNLFGPGISNIYSTNIVWNSGTSAPGNYNIVSELELDIEKDLGLDSILLKDSQPLTVVETSAGVIESSSVTDTKIRTNYYPTVKTKVRNTGNTNKPYTLAYTVAPVAGTDANKVYVKTLSTEPGMVSDEVSQSLDESAFTSYGTYTLSIELKDQSNNVLDTDSYTLSYPSPNIVNPPGPGGGSPPDENSDYVINNNNNQQQQNNQPEKKSSASKKESNKDETKTSEKSSDSDESVGDSDSAADSGATTPTGLFGMDLPTTGIVGGIALVLLAGSGIFVHAVIWPKVSYMFRKGI